MLYRSQLGMVSCAASTLRLAFTRISTQCSDHQPNPSMRSMYAALISVPEQSCSHHSDTTAAAIGLAAVSQVLTHVFRFLDPSGRARPLFLQENTVRAHSFSAHCIARTSRRTLRPSREIARSLLHLVDPSPQFQAGDAPPAQTEGECTYMPWPWQAAEPEEFSAQHAELWRSQAFVTCICMQLLGRHPGVCDRQRTSCTSDPSTG